MAEQDVLESNNSLWQRQIEQIPNLSSSPFPVLILGESGSGKEVLAQRIHNLSSRHNGPLISLNCSALSETLIESELFGHVKGSFTGAHTDRRGAFEAARSGTLFLDEIGDLPISLQPKLLRALENSEIRPVGSDRTIKTNVRLIAATQPSLLTKVKLQEFRSDLFFRLNVLTLNPPPLRHRLEDFERLAYHFGKIYQVRFSHAAVMEMKNHSWPGNIRELKNFIARICTYFPRILIDRYHILQLLERQNEANQMIDPTTLTSQRLKQVERNLIIERLTINLGNQRRTAMDLGIAKSTLHDRIRNYQIDIEKFVVPRASKS